jgi:outer membrane protein TolC
VVQTNLDQLQAFFEANRLSRLQVEQARQSLLNAESQLISLEADYQDRLDTFKLVLGLPPDLAVRAADPLLDQFDLISPSLTATQETVSSLLAQLRQKDQPLAEDVLTRLASLRGRVGGEMEQVQADLAKLAEALPARRKNLALLADREEVRSGKVYPVAYDVRALDARTAKLAEDYPTLVALVKTTFDRLDESIAKVRAAGKAGGDKPAPDVPDVPREQLTEAAEQLSDRVLQLSLVQAAARLDTVPLIWIDLGSEEAFRVARANRPDWMNARAALVDTWRQIEVTANALESGLNLTVDGDINTVGNNPVKFRSSTGRLRVGVQFDAPLTRVAERNEYRAAQIAYQQARRDYYAFEDRINQILRTELRDIRVNQLDFELRRAAVFVAITQLDLTRMSLRKPPKAGETSEFGATTARDLLQASSALLDAQNNFLTSWLNYEIQRLNLDFDLGTMRLDENGMWIDPGPIQADYASSEEAIDDRSEAAPLPPAPGAAL